MFLLPLKKIQVFNCFSFRGTKSRPPDLRAVTPGVPKPLEKATPTSYADSPFVDNIALVETPKRFNVPPMKAYDGSTDPLEHVAQYK